MKLKATRGVGYDLIIPSDYAVAMLAEEGLLKIIDRTKLPFWEEINPQLLGHHYDPNNNFSIPYEWEIFGFGIDKNYFAKYPLKPSWKMIFDRQTISYNITMINDPFEAIQFAAFYLFGPIDHLTPLQAKEVRKLLMQQKRWVEAYAEFRGDYFLATKNCPVVLASSSYIWRTMRQFPFVSFAVPEEGTFITIENLSIPAASEKTDLVYRFINYLYKPSTIAAHYKTFGFFPATLHALENTDLEPEAKKLLHSNFKNYHFIRRLLPEQQMRDLWIEVKSQKPIRNN